MLVSLSPISQKLPYQDVSRNKKRLDIQPKIGWSCLISLHANFLINLELKIKVLHVYLPVLHVFFWKIYISYVLNSEKDYFAA